MKNPKQAGVMALFYPDVNNETHLILILRKTYEGVHSAQVGFPGGKLEDSDVSLESAAIRETNEEIGVPIGDIQIICEMTEVYIPPSNFLVQPFLAVVSITPNFVKEDSEVEALIEVPLEDIVGDHSLVTKTVSTSYNLAVEVPAFKLNEHIVWGATAMMLSEIKDLINRVL